MGALQSVDEAVSVSDDGMPAGVGGLTGTEHQQIVLVGMAQPCHLTVKIDHDVGAVVVRWREVLAVQTPRADVEKLTQAGAEDVCGRTTRLAGWQT